MTQEEFNKIWEEHLELVENVYEVYIALRPLEDMILLETEDRRLAISRASLEEMLGLKVEVQILGKSYFVVKYEE